PSSMTATSVLSWLKAARHLLMSFGLRMGQLHRLDWTKADGATASPSRRSYLVGCFNSAGCNTSPRCPIVSIIPDGQISRVRFETLAFLPWAFPRIGEV